GGGGGGGVSLLPLSEIRTRLRLASLLLSRSHNLHHAKSHLERALLLLSPLPSPPLLPLKLLAHSLLSRTYHLLGSFPSQRALLLRALHLLRHSPSFPAPESLLWTCNFHAQLASALAVDADYPGALSSLATGSAAAADLRRGDLQLFFAASALHVRLLHWDDSDAVADAARRCADLWDAFPFDQREHCPGLFFYTEMLQAFYLLRICDYKTASLHVEKLDTAMKNEMHKLRQLKEMSSDGWDSNDDDKLVLAPPPMDGEWLPRNAVFALVDLMVLMVGRPKGIFKECGKRIQSGLRLIHEELGKLGIQDRVAEVDLQHSTIWMAGLYLMLLVQFLENKVSIELTRCEFVEAQEGLVEMKRWFVRFPTILQGCESTIEMLRGQYAHSVGCFQEAAFHFIEATKLTESKSMQSMCQVYAAVSYLCLGDAESSSEALDLIGPVYRVMDSFVGVREKTCIIFVYGLLLMRQHNLQEARTRLASGLKIAYQQLGNIQLVSQYLTILGTLALQLHDTGQAREILKSSLTLAKTLYDIPTQIWVLSILTGLYRELGERGNEIENSEYEQKKEDDLQRRLAEAHSSSHHLALNICTLRRTISDNHEHMSLSCWHFAGARFTRRLVPGSLVVGKHIEKARFKAQPLHEVAMKRAIAGPSTKVDLDIPESVGLPAPQPVASASRLRDMDSVRRGKRKI
ncbi:uncharacterized protein LOC109726609, partial [Ananas comosus]|uniref:Uncharacterized protein LOC109726609 n=1 Tax=Ananas comosus TaxID=4615 RepID=A0A6P5GT97_ANACO